MRIIRREMDKSALDAILGCVRASWTRATSIAPEKWSPGVPSIGQCAVTALVLQDYLGGKIMRCEVAGNGSHYWLVLDDDQEIDITADQFGEKVVRLNSNFVNRRKIVENPDTALRYETLLREVVSCLFRHKDQQGS